MQIDTKSKKNCDSDVIGYTYDNMGHHCLMKIPLEFHHQCDQQMEYS